MDMTYLQRAVRLYVAYRRARDPMVTDDDLMLALLAAYGARFGEEAVRDAVRRLSLAPSCLGLASSPDCDLWACSHWKSRPPERPHWSCAR